MIEAYGESVVATYHGNAENGATSNVCISLNAAFKYPTVIDQRS